MLDFLADFPRGALVADAQAQHAPQGIQQIRHLPVVDQDGKLLGWVTAADLRGVLIASMLAGLTVEDVIKATEAELILDNVVRMKGM